MFRKESAMEMLPKTCQAFCSGQNISTYWGRVMHVCIGNLGRHWFRLWLVSCMAQSHYLNQCWNIVNWTLGNKFQWNFNLTSNIVIQENAFEYGVCKIVALLSEASMCWLLVVGIDILLYFIPGELTSSMYIYSKLEDILRSSNIPFCATEVLSLILPIYGVLLTRWFI